MTTDEPPTPDREPTDDEADRLIGEALRRAGRFVPQSPEEVAGAEAELDEAAVELPPGLRGPLALLGGETPGRGSQATPLPQATPPVAHTPAEPASARPALSRRPDDLENPMRRTRLRKMIAWLVVIGTVGIVAGSQYVGWQSRSGELRDRELALQVSLGELSVVQAEQAAAQAETRKHVDAALAAEAEVRKQYRAAHESARKAIADKDFVVRLTGPAHVQPVRRTSGRSKRSTTGPSAGRRNWRSS